MKMLTAKEFMGFPGNTLAVSVEAKDYVKVEIPHQNKRLEFPRKGGEGVCYQGKLHIHEKGTKFEQQNCILKIYRVGVEERKERFRALINDLGDLAHHTEFWGLPLAYLNGVVLNGVEITAAIYRDLVDYKMENMNTLRNAKNWNPSISERIDQADKLCSVVSVLEKEGYVHGDLSCENIMMGDLDENSSGNPEKDALVLIDYDGFYKKGVVQLPDKKGQRFKTYGTKGYQIPTIKKELREKKAHKQSVVTDRFALGVLVSEIMVWGKESSRHKQDNREVLLTDEMLDSRTLVKLEKGIRSIWPEGINLLEETLKIDNPQGYPSPEDWMSILRGRTGNKNTDGAAATPKPFTKKIYIQLSTQTNRSGDYTYIDPILRVLSKQKGTFSFQNPILEKLEWEVEGRGDNRKIVIINKTGEQILVSKNNGDPRKAVAVRQSRFYVGPKSFLFIRKWRILFDDK